MKFKALVMVPYDGEFEIRPLVLCKDCKHFDGDEELPFGNCMENGICTKPNWFCADGEADRVKTRRYYTKDETLSWEGEDDDG